MTVTWQTLVAIAAILAAFFAIIGYINKAFTWFHKQDEQTKDIEALKKKEASDNAEVKEELTMLTYGVLACLKGLHEQGCDGPVDDAINRFEKYLNKKAHDQL